MVVVSLLVIRNSVGGLGHIHYGMMQEPTRVVQLRSQLRGRALVSFVAAGQVLLGTGLEIGFVPTRAAEAEARHGQQLFKLWRLTDRAVDQRCIADLLNGFQLMTTGSTLIIVHRHGGCLGDQIATAHAGFCGKERDYIH